MLTRLEVDGFKNLLGFVAEFGPFTCIAGANAVGKSNLFDAIEFLSLLADHPPDEAAQRLRGGSEDTDARDLFWRGPGKRWDVMRLNAEMIVPTLSTAESRSDDLVMPTNFLRYEIVLKYEAARGTELVGRAVIAHETLRVIPFDEIERLRRLGFSQVAADIVEFSPGDRTIGGASFSGPAPASNRAHLSQDPILGSVFRELQSWRRLALEPTAMRVPDRFKSPQQLGADGSHLAATLYRITHQENTEPVDVYAELASRLSELTPVRDVRIDRDDKRELLTLEADLRQVGWVSARALSEGTLRFLALASLALDPDAPRLVCIEEPENGIHPAAVGLLAELLRTTAHAPERQIIVNTHSPVFVRHVHERAPEDLVMARLVGTTSREGTATRALRLKPLVDTWRCHDNLQGVGLAALIDYLESPRQED